MQAIEEQPGPTTVLLKESRSPKMIRLNMNNIDTEACSN